MGDLAGSFTCFESFTIPCILCICLTIFWGLTISQDVKVRSFIYEFKNWWYLILKNKTFLDGVNLCLKFYDGNLGDMLA